MGVGGGWYGRGGGGNDVFCVNHFYLMESIQTNEINIDASNYTILSPISWGVELHWVIIFPSSNTSMGGLLVSHRTSSARCAT